MFQNSVDVSISDTSSVHVPADNNPDSGRMAGPLLHYPSSQTCCSSLRFDIPLFLKQPICDPIQYRPQRKCRRSRAESELNSVQSSVANVNSEPQRSNDPSGNAKYRIGGTQSLVDANEYVTPSLEKELVERISLTGGAVDFRGATKPLVHRQLGYVKQVVLVRHGLSSWNKDSKIQGSSDLSTLSEKGALQALKCKKALSNLEFDQCFASPISRAKSSAELIWGGREEPLFFMDTLREAHLHFLEGMRNEDAKQQFPELYKAWREDPANFHIEGVYPVVELWGRARKAWEEILSAKGQRILVVTHKSILRALICTALGMGPDRFRAIDVNNGGISSFTISKDGEPLLQNLNMTSHLFTDGVYY